MTKYRAKPTVVDGIRFHSRKEANRYCELKMLEKAGAISALELQPRFHLLVNGTKICDYVGDFQYVENGLHKLEDVKGMLTREYKLKKKLLLAIHGIEVVEI